jgi:peptidoglycan hydrolase-like protein with peptidoglycan-binding domain
MAYRVGRVGKEGPVVDYYNLDASVGATGWNKTKADVMLVQILFRIVYHDYGPGSKISSHRPPPALPPNSKPIVVDGKFGPITHAYIADFKEEMRRKGFSTPADGRIDPFIIRNTADYYCPMYFTQHYLVSVLDRLNYDALRVCEYNNDMKRFCLHSPGRSTDDGGDVPRELWSALQKKIV